MRKPILLCCLLLSFKVSGQIQLSAAEWQQDLKFLQETVHNDYSFLFRKISSQQFDQEVMRLHQEIPNLANHQIIVGMARLISLFGYGHTSLRLSGWDQDNIFGFHQMPFNLYYFSNGVFIQGVHEQYRQALGAQVLKIEGVPVLEAIEKVRPVIPVENEQFLKAYGMTYLGSPEILHAQGVKKSLDQRVTLTLKKQDKIFDQVFTPIPLLGYPLVYGLIPQNGPWLDARDAATTPHWLKHLDRIYYKEYIKEHKTLYVRHSQIQDDSIDIPTFYQEVFEFVNTNPVEKLVIDVRLNGGGNNYKNKPILTGILENKSINAPDKLFVILGRRTFSACQNLVNELDNYTQATFVGEPTSENINFYGDNTEVKLPNSNIPIRLSFAWWQDKPPWENAPWLAPDVAVDLRFEDYIQGRDPVLETILDFSIDSVLVDPMEHLTGLYFSGKADQIFPEAKRLIGDHKYRYYPFEQRFNELGKQLINTGQFEPAKMILQMNTSFYPNTASGWSGLALAYWRTGDSEKAIELCQKVLELEPEGPNAEQSRNMLKKIRQ